MILGDPGTDLNNAGSSGGKFTPLTIAAIRDERDIVRYSLSKGVNVNKEHKDGGTAAFVAAEVGNLEVLKLLQAQGANLNALEQLTK